MLEKLLLTICKFFKLPISGGKYSKSLSPKYNALRLSVKYKKKNCNFESQHTKQINKNHSPIIKKFPGRAFSFKLLYVKSRISSTGNAPKPLGSPYNRLSDTFKIRSLGKEDKLTGNSSI